MCDLLFVYFKVSFHYIEDFNQEIDYQHYLICMSVTGWLIQLENGCEIQALFLNLQKAFNSVPHGMLLKKLNYIRISIYLY